MLNVGQNVKTTEVATAKRHGDIAALVRALSEANRLIARDGGAQLVSLREIRISALLMNFDRARS
jgi:hypothetical protein